MQDVATYSTLLSSLVKPSGHRLGALMTMIHAHNIWSFFTYTLKYTVERQRPKYYYTRDPKSSNTLSFPSGHTGRTFLMVSVADTLFDLPTWSRIGMYGFAGSVGVLRIASDKHFFSDVTAAMGIAYFSAWLSYKIFEEPHKTEEKNIAYRLIIGPSYIGLRYQI